MGLPLHLASHDALLVVDVQQDFVDGALAVPHAQAILPAINRAIGAFARRGLPVVATRDWHPALHMSFAPHGGAWPVHCVAGTAGAAFAAGLELPADVRIISKATAREREAYSAFDGTPLHGMLQAAGVRRLVVAGLATDYCVRASVMDALRLGYRVFLLADAIAAVDATPGAGEAAIDDMRRAGAALASVRDLEQPEAAHG